MDITKTDFSILMVATILVILMTITFPAMGLADNSDTKNASDLYDEFPTLSVDGDRFDFAGSFPEAPSLSENLTSDGSITVDYGSLEKLQISGEELYGNIGYTESISTGDDFLGATLVHQVDDSREDDVKTISNPSTGDNVTVTIPTADSGQTGNWTVSFIVEDVSTEENITVSANVLEVPDNEPGFLVRVTAGVAGAVPFIGGMLKAGVLAIGMATTDGGIISVLASIASIIAYIGEAIIWFPLALMTFITNGLGAIVDAAVYLFSFTNIVINTMLLIVTELPPPIALFYVLPIFGMFGVLAKLLLVAVGKLPFT